MKQNNLTIMLGLSFYKNSDQVLETLGSFSPRVVTTSNKLIIGLENELHKESIPKTKRGTSLFDELHKQGWETCYVWDDGLNRRGISILQGCTTLPFYGNFSYGAAVNRLMLLARIAGAAALVRIDPGTSGGPDFDKLLKRHLEIIWQNPGAIVSAQYSRRQAIRDEFIVPENLQTYYDLIKNYTGINPAPNCQLTGGAAFTMTTDSPPAIPFDGVKVWGSDDGFFQITDPERAIVQKEFAVGRAEAGFVMNVTAYLERVANMVVLKALHDGQSVDGGFGKAQLFADEMDTLVDPKHCFDKKGCLANVNKGALPIMQGYVNYVELRKHWVDLQRTIKEGIPVDVADAYGEKRKW